MIIKFSKTAKAEYDQLIKENDQASIKKIKELLQSILDHGLNKGIGRPEELRYMEYPTYSRRINRKDRLVYQEHGEALHVLSCKGHYENI